MSRLAPVPPGWEVVESPIPEGWELAQDAPPSPSTRRAEPLPTQPPAPRQPAPQQATTPPAQQAAIAPPPQQQNQPAQTEFEFEGQRYSFSPEYKPESIARWFNKNVLAERRKLTREQATGRAQAYDSDPEQKLRRSTPVGQQGLKEYAEFLSGKDADGNPVVVKPEEVTPTGLAAVVAARKKEAERAAKEPGTDPLALREFNEDTAAMEMDLGRLWATETTLEHKQRLAAAKGLDPLAVKPTASASARDAAVLNSRPGYVARKDQPRESFWAENLLREYRQKYGSELPRDKKTLFDKANEAYDVWLKANPAGADPEFDAWRSSKPTRPILHPEEMKATEERRREPTARNHYDSLSEAMVARHAYDIGQLDIVPYVLKRIPFAGTAVEAADLLTLRSAVKNIEADKATDSDWFTLASAIDVAEKNKDRGLGKKVWDLVSHLPGMGVEFTMTAGGFTWGRAAAESLAQRYWVNR